jgi:nucleoside-diphosphate-sugar epimerase/acyl carrier protein
LEQLMTDLSPPAGPAPATAATTTWDTARILAVYADVLAAATTIDSDFFALGGHSLTAVVLADRLRELLHVPVTGLEVMDHPTPGALITTLRARAAGSRPVGGASAAPAADRMTVLVTGGTGGVGSFVVSELLAHGHRVRALARPESVPVLDGTGAEVVEGDLARPDGLRAAADEADAVLHVACTFTEPRVDVAALRSLADGWHGGPFVFVSSVDAYGTPAEHRVREGQPSPEGRTSDYGRGKAECERVLLDRADRHGARDRVSLVRVPLVWGPHRRLRDQLRWGAMGFHQQAVRGEPILLPETNASGSRWLGLPWVGAAALARALVTMVDQPAGGVVNAVGGHVGWAEYAAELVSLLGSDSPVRTDPAAPEALHRPWRYLTDEFDARYGPVLREDWRPLLAATLSATDQDRETVA